MHSKTVNWSVWSWVLCLAAVLAGCSKKSGQSPAESPPPDQTPGDEDASSKDDDRNDATPEAPGGRPPSPPADDAPARPADPRTSAYCEEDWRRYVSNHVVGLVKGYERTTRSTGVIASESTRTWTETVIAVSADAITVERAERTVRPAASDERRSTRTIPKAIRFNDCLGLATTNDPTVTTEVVESRDESVTVPAGTFPTTYSKTRETGIEDDRPYEHLSEIWTIQGTLPIVAKAETVWTTTKNGEPFEESATMTLTELRFP